MDWRQIAAIWLLSVALGGLAITLIVLYLHRDRPAHAAPRRPLFSQRPDILAAWQETGDLVRRFMESRAAFHDRRPRQDDSVPAGPPADDHADTLNQVHAWYARMDELTTQAFLDAGGVGWR